MLQKEDAQLITAASKEAHIKGKVVELIPMCFNEIRKTAKSGYYETKVVIVDQKFQDEICAELSSMLEKCHYEIKSQRYDNNSKTVSYIYISWKD